MCSIGLLTPNLELEQMKSLLAISVSVCVPQSGRCNLVYFYFLGRLGSKYTFKIWFNLLGRYLQAGRQRELRRVVNWLLLLHAESAMIFLILGTCLCFSVTGNEVQEHIVCVWYSMSADQGLGVSVPVHLHLSNGRLHMKLLKMLIQFLLSTLQG